VRDASSLPQRRFAPFRKPPRRTRDPQIPIPPDLFAKVTETIYPTICDAPHRASLHAYGLSNEYKGSETFSVQGRGLLLLLGRELPLPDLSQA
jgi:hypothetical protein